MREEAVLFGSAASLAGVVSLPQGEAAARPAFVFLNAGVTHRVGPSRLYVQLARRLAQDGFTSLRFDFSGIGDSGVRTDDVPPVQSVFSETQEALELLERQYGVERFVLAGICSGATISYLTAKDDPRIAGAVLINAQGHLHGMDSELGAHLRSRTLAHHFWRIATRSSFRAKNVVKAIRGQLDPKRILGTMVALPLRMLMARRGNGEQTRFTLPDAAAELEALGRRGLRLLHVYSEGDDGLDYFQVVVPKEEWARATAPPARFEMIAGANHVFTLRWSQACLVELVTEWARDL